MTGNSLAVPESAEWFKSSYSSGAEGQCVEIAALPGTVGVRDSKDLARQPLAVSADAWNAFASWANRN
jgi:hypothetical protein